MSEAQIEHSNVIKNLHISRYKKLSGSYSDMFLISGLAHTR